MLWSIASSFVQTSPVLFSSFIASPVRTHAILWAVVTAESPCSTKKTRYLYMKWILHVVWDFCLTSILSLFMIFSGRGRLSFLDEVVQAGNNWDPRARNLENFLLDTVVVQCLSILCRALTFHYSLDCVHVTVHPLSDIPNQSWKCINESCLSTGPRCLNIWMSCGIDACISLKVDNIAFEPSPKSTQNIVSML